MIDTGADYTILQSEAGRVLLGVWDEDPQINQRRDAVSVTGLGNATLRCLVQRVGLGFTDADGEAYHFAQPILVAEPVRRLRRGQSYWEMPSLLGRDVLQHFELNLSYDPLSVSLILNR